MVASIGGDECVEQLRVGLAGRADRAFLIKTADSLDSLARAGVDTLELSTDDDLVQAILRFTDMRKRRSRMGAGARLPSHLKLVA